ncbi:ribose-5-phosphate isomerase RpiA [Oenococcus kitaharae]|uniref:Ribose-5-phosphate isomerase A n=1 Tax=Oenococcus kitaharae DSM 17330 TaxID=1045004 RepID=G9WJ16_9LACO|nr:ribose-5-phosphate isomerase RpiA [Oenococcus kitaharae]EHN58465.1 Ribose 5-phosphate isomerase A [Oenococcus kitaharae DSM 17330]OEY81380.1 ribose 5-phosphate isomerase [Oenococcus kitaharae]OEY82868.1 ribose 5-phosphate isomerase [Oenococcus kitaharae]OEY84588.1 ribose 5-phosphate isomerase [Oenococcus kitaharae]
MNEELQNKLKKAAAVRVADYVKDGMIVGLGSGSTVRMLVDELGRRVQEEGLQFTAVATSILTATQAKKLGIKVVDLDSVDSIDLTIDGADQVDSNFNGIKGGGGNLLWEKIVAINSKKIVWVVDESKIVDTIGAFPLAVDVIPFGSQHVLAKFNQAGFEPVIRKDQAGHVFKTDSNNIILDLHLHKITQPVELADELIKTVGVVEHGLFLNMVSEVVVGKESGPEVLVNPNLG